MSNYSNAIFKAFAKYGLIFMTKNRYLKGKRSLQNYS